MEENTYGIRLVAIVNQFKNKMQEVKNNTENTVNTIKEKFNSVKNEQMTGNGVNNDIIKIAQLKKEIQSLKQEMKGFDPDSVAFKDYAIWISEAENELNSLVQKQKQSNVETKKMNTEINKIKKVPSMFEKITKKITRYGMALLSVRGIIALVSRASSAYLSQDIELAGKLQSVWAGMGAFLAPILDAMANAMMKMVKYLNVFIKALTGQDLLAKASAKATNRIKEQTKAQKGLNKSLTAMDEITNLQDNESGGIGGAGVENPFDKFNEVDINTEFADKITAFGEYIKDNWKAIALGIGGITLAIEGLKLMTKGEELALFGQKLFGIGLIVIGVVGAFKSWNEYMELFNQGLQDTQKGWKTFYKTLTYIGVAIAGIGILIGNWPLAIAGAVIAVVAIIGQNWDKIRKGIIKATDWVDEKLRFLFGDTLGDMISAPFKDAIGVIIYLFDGLFLGFKQFIDGVVMMFKGDLKNGIIKAVKGIANMVIGVLNSLGSGVNLMLAPMRALIVGVGKLTGKNWSMRNIRIPRIPKLATGTNYVPEDQLAYIHKGEAVIPKKFNSAEYFSNINNNQETNALLMEVNKTLIELKDKDSNLYINGKELAQATYKDYENEKNRLGKSSVVVRG